MNLKIKSLCECDAPYPEIRVERQNVHYANLISLAYAGQDSELTSVLLYSYGHQVMRGKSPEMLSGMLSHIAMMEMRHLEMLGELIVLLGGDPRFCGPRRMGINTAMLGYASEPARILRGAISGEEAAIRLYGDLIKNINDGYVRAVLKRIIMDEEQHLKIFKEMASTSVYKGR